MFVPTAEISMKIHCNTHLDKPVCMWCCKLECSWDWWNDLYQNYARGFLFRHVWSFILCFSCKVIVIHSTKQQFAALLMATFFCLIHHCALWKAGVLCTQQNGNSIFFNFKHIFPLLGEPWQFYSAWLLVRIQLCKDLNLGLQNS